MSQAVDGATARLEAIREGGAWTIDLAWDEALGGYVARWSWETPPFARDTAGLQEAGAWVVLKGQLSPERWQLVLSDTAIPTWPGDFPDTWGGLSPPG